MEAAGGSGSNALEVAAVFLLAASLLVPLYTYFVYPALLALFNMFARPAAPPDLEDTALPTVTMLLAAHNEAGVIAGKVANFLALDYPADRLNLVIGSDGSTDDTVRLAKQAAADSRRIRVCEFEEQRGKVNVFNDLVPGIESEIVVMSDANTMYRSAALKKLVRRFADAGVGGVCGRLVLTVSEGGSAEEGLYWRYETLVKRLEGGLGALSAVNGQVFAFRKPLFEPLPADAITEDQHLGLAIMRRGYRIAFEPEAVVEESAGDFEAERRRRIRISTGNFQAFFRAGLRLLAPPRGRAAFAYFSHKVLRLAVPAALLVALGSNALLVARPAGCLLLAGQLLFYAAALLPLVFRPLRRLAAFRILHYFLVMNLAVAHGFFRYVFSRPSARW